MDTDMGDKYNIIRIREMESSKKVGYENMGI